MLQRLLLTVLFSGTVAGIVLTIFHLAAVQPLILKAENYEKLANSPSVIVRHVHQTGLSHNHAGGNVPHLHEKNFHIHAEGTAHVHPNVKTAHAGSASINAVNNFQGAHSHSDLVWSPKEGIERSLYTLVANILTAIAFSFLLVSGFIFYGGSITFLNGMLWGLAGFACFSFLPALGLPPELPGSVAGDLLARQIWWLGIAVLSVAGLSVLVFCSSNVWRAVGLLLLIAPHALGAPVPEAGAIGASPPELAAHFAVISLFSSAVMWVVMGIVAACLFDKFLIENFGSYSRTQEN